MEKIFALMTSHKNVNEVSCEFVKFIKCYHDANDLQESLSLQLPEEVKRLTVYFQSKVTAFFVFMDKGLVAGSRRSIN